MCPLYQRKPTWHLAVRCSDKSAPQQVIPRERKHQKKKSCMYHCGKVIITKHLIYAYMFVYPKMFLYHQMCN